MRHKFYGESNNIPLSAAHNTPSYEQSIIGRLNRKTDQAIFIRELPYFSQSADFCWRVTGAEMLQEDGLMTYFKAYDLTGKFLPGATFGVHWDKMPNQISGGFQYKPEFGNHYYVPLDNQFPTPESGGYTVQVLELDYPSEGLAFGMYKQAGLHQCLKISFRLFPIGAGYPNDVQESR